MTLSSKQLEVIKNTSQGVKLIISKLSFNSKSEFSALHFTVNQEEFPEEFVQFINKLLRYLHGAWAL